MTTEVKLRQGIQRKEMQDGGTEHRNTKYPALHNKAALEELMKSCGTPTRIAERIGCGRPTVVGALKKFGIKRTGYVVDESMRKRLRLN